MTDVRPLSKPQERGLLKIIAIALLVLLILIEAGVL